MARPAIRSLDEMPVLSDWELWACAAQLERQHGERAPLFLAERIGALAISGDDAGVSTWKAIAARLAKLRNDASASSEQ